MPSEQYITCFDIYPQRAGKKLIFCIFFWNISYKASLLFIFRHFFIKERRTNLLYSSHCRVKPHGMRILAHSMLLHSVIQLYFWYFVKMSSLHNTLLRTRSSFALKRAQSNTIHGVADTFYMYVCVHCIWVWLLFTKQYLVDKHGDLFASNLGWEQILHIFFAGYDILSIKIIAQLMFLYYFVTNWVFSKKKRLNEKLNSRDSANPWQIFIGVRIVPKCQLLKRQYRRYKWSTSHLYLKV